MFQGSFARLIYLDWSLSCATEAEGALAVPVSAIACADSFVSEHPPDFRPEHVESALNRFVKQEQTQADSSKGFPQGLPVSRRICMMIQVPRSEKRLGNDKRRTRAVK